jgi:hypothetical protein
MPTALGLLAFVFFIAAVIAFAAGVTWLVVKISPAQERKPEPPAA